MKFHSLLIGAASAAALTACATNAPAPRETARIEPRPAPITSPTARELPPRETTRVQAAPQTKTPVVTGPMAGELNLAALIGTDVKDPAGQTIGEIDDVVLDSAGRVETVIVTTGGFMGFGGRDVELRWADLKMIDAGNEVKVDKTAMQLRQMPEYQRNRTGTTTTFGAKE